MAALGISTTVYILPNPTTSNHPKDLIVAHKNITFGTSIEEDILTLHTGPAQRGDDISGLLYVPELPLDHPCASTDHIPRNATRLNDLPDLKLDLIGYIPWLSQNCSIAYLNAATSDHGKTKAVLFYTLINGNQNTTMPSLEDPMWDIPFGRYKFPVYAINGREGMPLMDKVAEYSGNMTDVWEHPLLATTYNTSDFARIYMEVNTGRRNPLPGLWLFLLIVLGVLIFIVAFTSMVMHWLQYRHRASLRRRVASGEIDLEAMGIKRLTIPKEILDKFSLRTYYDNPSPPPSRHTSSDNLQNTSAQSSTQKISIESVSASPAAPLPQNTQTSSTIHTPIQTHAYSQPSCAVCLDEFESGKSIVRELPCLHIFHPECIDSHLLSNSSLCPLCKASALPKGYVPTHLTNATVRRERNMRRLRQQQSGSGPAGSATLQALENSTVARLLRLPQAWRYFNRWSDEPNTHHHDIDPAHHHSRVSLPEGTEMRRYRQTSDLERRSFSATAAPTQEEEDEEWRNMSLWSRFLKQAFPR